MKISSRIKTTFIGSSKYALFSIHRISDLVAVFVEDNFHKEEVVRFCKREGLKFYYVRYSSDILKIILEEKLNIDIVFVSNTSVLLKQDLIDQFKVVYNLHNGDLASNRGAHPIINKNDFMYLVCHIIDSEDIDKGRIVCQIKIPINYNLDFISNINIIQRLSSSLLEHVIYCYTEYNGDVASIQADIKNNSYKHRLDNDIKNRIQNLAKLSEINDIKNITEA